MHMSFEQTLLWPYHGHEHCDSVDDEVEEKLHVTLHTVLTLTYSTAMWIGIGNFTEMF